MTNGNRRVKFLTLNFDRLIAHQIIITHPDVVIDPSVPIPDWPLNERGQARMRAMISHPWAKGVRRIFASNERKARDAAQILADGLGLSGYVRSAEGSSAVVNFVYLPMAIISGTFFTPKEYPGFLRAIAEVLPLTYFTKATREVMSV